MDKKTESLMTKKELGLVRSTSFASLNALPARSLKSLIKRARKLRGKYRDLTRRQKRKRQGSENRRTVEKARVFADALRRLETRAERIIDPCINKDIPRRVDLD